jgi:hypothetical protein
MILDFLKIKIVRKKYKKKYIFFPLITKQLERKYLYCYKNIGIFCFLYIIIFTKQSEI